MKTKLLIMAACVFSFTGCMSLPSNYFEKNVPVPDQKWASSFKPTISFTIGPKDTTERFNVSLVLRHTDAYLYNNIWIKGTIRKPGDSTGVTSQYDLALGNNNGWFAKGMDDIYEQRLPLLTQTGFSKPGTYSFTLEQIMREDPLPHVMNVGVRLEKVQ